MSTEIGLCIACKNQSDCSMHMENPEAKVTDCEKFSMVDALRKAWELLHGQRTVDGNEKKDADYRSGDLDRGLGLDLVLLPELKERR